MTIVLPGAQSLVAAILTDGWTHVRTALARRWSRQTHEPQTDIEHRLDTAHSQASDMTVGHGDGEQALLQAYWAGYLAAVLAERPALVDLVRDLPGTLTAPDSATSVQNTNSGTVTTLVQGRDISGGITFGAP
ncbi:hypothetical protein [Streptacidiphilus sp. P02-A3a]|uniref:hypothetical protein n=1 Tax=Streptacidiphilus sp. P02-A3a TaxID=2704468 RepID=UPI0015F97D8F|nr:hypothetical protein [Streptacidiphilus sp. P02-A3a]QMU68371.1 hypothetical protein GXP74_09155 [Streptacidiphilus sp. P02-A3a]